MRNIAIYKVRNKTVDIDDAIYKVRNKTVDIDEFPLYKPCITKQNISN